MWINPVAMHKFLPNFQPNLPSHTHNTYNRLLVDWSGPVGGAGVHGDPVHGEQQLPQDQAQQQQVEVSPQLQFSH